MLCTHLWWYTHQEKQTYRKIDGESFGEMNVISSPLVGIGWRIDFHPFHWERKKTELNETDEGIMSFTAFTWLWNKNKYQQRKHVTCFIQFQWLNAFPFYPLKFCFFLAICQKLRMQPNYHQTTSLKFIHLFFFSLSRCRYRSFVCSFVLIHIFQSKYAKTAYDWNDLQNEFYHQGKSRKSDLINFTQRNQSAVDRYCVEWIRCARMFIVELLLFSYLDKSPQLLQFKP